MEGGKFIDDPFSMAYTLSGLACTWVYVDIEEAMSVTRRRISTYYQRSIPYAAALTVYESRDVVMVSKVKVDVDESSGRLMGGVVISSPKTKC